MKERGEGETDLETQFFALTDAIVAKLDERFQARTDGIGGIYTRMVSNEQEGGGQALVINNNGKWSGKMDMMGWEIGENPPIDRLLGYYASIKDPEYRALEHQSFQASSDHFHNASPEVQDIIGRRVDAMMKKDEKVELTAEEQQLLDEFHRSNDDVDKEWQDKKLEYILENRTALLKSFIASLEDTLEQF